MIGPSLDDLRSIEVRIEVAGGRDNGAAVVACLRRGHATMLVTDATAAAAS